MKSALEVRTTSSPLEYTDDFMSHLYEYRSLSDTSDLLEWSFVDLPAVHTDAFFGLSEEVVDTEALSLLNSTWGHDDALSSKSVSRFLTLLSSQNATWEQASIWEYEYPDGLFVIVDFTNALASRSEADPPWLTADQRAALAMLRLNSRPVVASRLKEILAERANDPDGSDINIASLWALVNMLARQYAFADPAIGPDNQGLMYAQWLIDRNGVVAFGFPEGDEVLFVAHQKSEPRHEGIAISERGLEQDIVNKYGYLVPRRSLKAARPSP